MKKFLSVFSNGPTSTTNSSHETDATSSSSTTSSSNKTSSKDKAKSKESSKAKSSSPMPPLQEVKVPEETNHTDNKTEETQLTLTSDKISKLDEVSSTQDKVTIPTDKSPELEEKSEEDSPKDNEPSSTTPAVTETSISKEETSKVKDEASSTDGNVTSSPTKNKKISESSTADLSAPSSHAKDLAEYDLHERLAKRLSALFDTNKLTIKDLDKRAIDALKEYGNIDAVVSILDEFESASLEHVNNKSAFLCGLMKTHRQKEKQIKILGGKESSTGSASGKNSSASNPTQSSTNGPASTPGPDEAKLKAILERTGYTLDVTSGQRKYGGPPPDYEEGSIPPAPGCEIFVGKIPKEVFEDELIPVFEEVGKIWDLRLMIDPVTGFNRGFAFITYCDKEDAACAQIKFDGYEIRKGKHLKVNVSVPNLRLFVGNIPKSRSREEILAEFAKVTVGLVEVIVYSSPDDRKKNRGFCFLEYDSHKSASLAKRKLGTGRQKFWGCDILVDWADPQEEPDQETMSKVKVLYVRNLVSSITEDNIRETFGKHGNVERVKKIKDYAFIHFEDRDQAVNAMNNLHDREMQGVKISVSLAKPPSDRRKKEEILRNRERRVSQMMQERVSMGLVSNQVAVAAAAMASGLQGVHPVLFNPATALAAAAAAGHLHHHNQQNPMAVNQQQAHPIPHALSTSNHSIAQPPSSLVGHLHQGSSLSTHVSSGTAGRNSKGNNRGNSNPGLYPIPQTNQPPNTHHPSYGRQVPPYQAPPGGWYPPDWSSYPIYPQNWVFDPRSQNHPTPMTAGPLPQYPRGMNVNAATAVMSAIAAGGQRNNNRSLWTPNGNVAAQNNVTNGPQHQDNKNKNWNNRRGSNTGNINRSDTKSGGDNTGGR